MLTADWAVDERAVPGCTDLRVFESADDQDTGWFVTESGCAVELSPGTHEIRLMPHRTDVFFVGVPNTATVDVSSDTGP